MQKKEFIIIPNSKRLSSFKVNKFILPLEDYSIGFDVYFDVKEKSKQVYDFSIKKIDELKANEDVKRGLSEAGDFVKDVARKTGDMAKEVYDKAMENEDVKKFADKTGEVLTDARKGVEDFMNKPETKEAIDKAKDTTIDLAEKAVQALKDWLKPEDK